jgi:5-methylcytosine-specific restriction enzyme subunit McrC
VTAAFVSLHEWETRRPDPGCPLEGLSLTEYPNAHQLASELTSSGQLQILELAQGLELRASSFVGRIELGALTIAIQPKITGMPLLNLLRYAYGLRNLTIFPDVPYTIDDVDFQDLLIQQLAAEVSDLFARGLHRDYKRIAGILTTPRGRIDFTRYVQMPRDCEPALPCIQYARSMDNFLNQVLLQGLELGSHIAADIELRSSLRRMAKIFGQGVSIIRLDRACMDGAWRNLDRRTTAYKPSLTLIGLLLEAQGVSLDESPGKLRFSGFLFDMNRFFQALLSRFLQEHLEDFVIRDECRLAGMFSYDSEHNPFHRSDPVLRPDFVVMKDNEVLAVLDTKYRDLSLQEHGLPREMLYQLSLYALSQPEGKRRAVILYPTMLPNVGDQVIRIQEPLHAATKAQVVLRSVCLPELEELLREPSNATQVRKKAELARCYVFGIRSEAQKQSRFSFP